MDEAAAPIGMEMDKESHPIGMGMDKVGIEDSLDMDKMGVQSRRLLYREMVASNEKVVRKETSAD